MSAIETESVYIAMGADTLPEMNILGCVVEQGF
jgi:hypothetical protein